MNIHGPWNLKATEQDTALRPREGRRTWSVPAPVTGPGTGRVLLVVPQPFYSDRGSPIAIREVVRAHLELNRKVDVLTFPVGQDFDMTGLRFIRSSNPFRIRSVPVGFSIRKLLLDMTLAWKLRGLLRTESYDLVHALEEAAFPAVWLARSHGTPVVYDMHSRLSDGLSGIPGLRRGPLRRMAIRLEEWLFRNARVIVTSRGLAPQVREVHPEATVFEWQFSGTLDGGESPSPWVLREELAIPPHAPVILYAGTFTRYQGVELLVRAAKVVADQVPGVVFVFVGSETTEDQSISRLVNELGLQGLVRIVPRQPRSVMRGYFAIADVLVSPRVSGDNIPLKIFDYLSADRPIVATDIATHRTVLNESIALLSAPDPIQLGQALTRVLEDHELAERLRRGAADYAKTRLGWPVFVRSLEQIQKAAMQK